MWIIWALLSAILAATRRPFEKLTIGKFHPFVYGFWVQLLGLPLLLVATALSGQFTNPFDLSWNYWLPALLYGLTFIPVNAILYKRAIADGELSKVLPLQSLTPAFSLLLAWFTLGEKPTMSAAFGITIIIIAVYVLGLKGKRLHHPLQPFKEDKASLAMLLNVLLITAYTLSDKVAIRASAPVFYSLTTCVLSLLSLYLMCVLSHQKLRIKLPPSLTLIGALQGGTYVTANLAIAVGPIAYVSALRSSNILMGAGLGVLLFKEKLTKPKVASLLLLVIGSLILTLA